MTHRRFPSYPDDADYNTNAPSYYDELARKQGLIKELAERIWGYEATLNLSMQDIAQRFIEWDSKIAAFDGDVNVLLQEWIVDGTFDNIINNKLFNLKADQADLTATNQLLETKIDRGEVAVTDINKNLGKFDQTYFTPETIQQWTGNTPVNTIPADDSLVTEMFVNKSVTHEKTDFIRKGKNLFNKATTTKGHYVETGSGALVPNANFDAGDFIPVIAGETLTASHFNQFSFYGSDRVYNYQNPTTPTFVVPVGSSYIRTSVEKQYVDTFQLERGGVATPYEQFGVYIDYLVNTDSALKESVKSLENQVDINSVGYFNHVLKQLENPFIKTQIVELGDSITAGLTGTGYSLTGEPIGATGVNSNIDTSTNWANMLNDNILDTYNKDVYVELSHPEIENGILEGYFEKNSGSLLKWRFVSENTKSNQKMKFRFYGTYFSVVYSRTTGTGIVEVWVDGFKVDELDTAGQATFNVEELYSGFDLDYHDVELRQTATKSEGSSNTVLYLEAIKIPKVVTVRNWGVSGITSEWVYDYLWTLLKNEDDILILQIGTNDRVSEKSPSTTRNFIREIVKQAQAKGIDVILMSANPTSVAQVNDNVTYNFDMHEVDVAISQVANEFNMSYISNYQHFIRYADAKGISVDTLIPDGLHPADLGYKVMYENIANELNIPLKREGL